MLLGRMYFLSYARRDERLAARICDHLAARGIEVWRDRGQPGLRTGSPWVRQIEEQLARSTAFLILVGTAGVTRWMQREFEVALQRADATASFAIIPLLRRGVMIEALPPILRTYQALTVDSGDALGASLEPLAEALGIRSVALVASSDGTFDPAARAHLVDLCRRQLEEEMAAFIGPGPTPDTYVERDSDTSLEALASPWSIPIPPGFGASKAAWWDGVKDLVLKSDHSRRMRALDVVCATLQDDLNGNAQMTALAHVERLRAASAETEVAVEHRMNELVAFLKRHEDGTPLTELASQLVEEFSSARSACDITALRHAREHRMLVERQFEDVKALLWSSLWEQHSLQLLARMRELDRALRASAEIAEWGARVAVHCGYRHTVLLDHAGKGKTWALARLARGLARRQPVFFVSARDPLWFREGTLLDTLVAILRRMRVSPTVSAAWLRELCAVSLHGDEQLPVIIDGIDTLRDPRQAQEHLMAIGAEAGPLPLRTIVSCRTTYWSWFRNAYDGRPHTHVATGWFEEFSEKEAQRAGAIPRSLRHPTVYGFARDLAGRGRSLDGAERSLNALVALERYAEELSRDLAARHGPPAWWIAWLPGALAELAFGARAKTPQANGVAAGALRSALRALAEQETGEYHPAAVEALVGAGLFLANETEVSFASDLFAEFALAKRLLRRRDDGHALDLDPGPHPTPTRIGVLAVVAASLAREGVELWEDFNADFEGRADWLAQIAEFTGASETSVTLVRALFEVSLGRLARFVTSLPSGSNPLLEGIPAWLDDRSVSTTLQGPMPPLREAISAVVPPRSLTFRVHDNPWGREDLPEAARADFDFWFHTLPVQLLPRLASSTMPEDARRLLIRACVRLCADRRVPAELTSATYRPLAEAFLAAGGRLDDESRLRILVCDDDMFYLQSFWMHAFNAILGENLSKQVLSITIVCTGYDAQERLAAEPWSLLLIDEIHPGPRGCEVVRWFRDTAKAEWRDMPIIFITGLGHTDGFASAGGDGFLSKPFSGDQFRDVVFGYGPRDRFHIAALEDRFLALIANRAR